MKICTIFTVALLALAGGLSTSQAQNTVYWDINGTDPGAGQIDGFTDGNWSTDSFWSLDPAGEATTNVWVPNDHAVFSAGSDATDSFVKVGGTQLASSLLVEEGIVWLAAVSSNSDNVNTGTSTVTVNEGATLRISNTLRLNNAGTLVLNGGTFWNSNPGNAGTFLGTSTAAKNIEINGTGTVKYEAAVDEFNTAPTGTVSILGGGSATSAGNGAKILGVGGTTDNGGAGTLIKTGTGELRFQGVGTADSTFAKLVVKEGLFRLGSVIPTGLPQQTSERGFGAAPLDALDDAITLDGGKIGVTPATILHVNRGITVTENGGGIVGTITMPANSTSKLTGTGPLSIEGTTSSGFVLLAPTSDFSGDLTVDALFDMGPGVNLNVESLSGASANGRIRLDNNASLTFGRDNTDTSYSGSISVRNVGPGSFTKEGTGVFTMFGFNYGNTGPSIINGGTIRFGNSAAGLGNTSEIQINNNATLDMNDINDTFGALSSITGHTTGAVLQGLGNITLARTTGTYTFEGTITGTGNFTKNAAANQILAGNNSLGNVTVNAGSLLFNGTNTTGTVTVVGGTLGGTGSVSGVVTVNTGGRVAPGSSGIESFDVGGLTLEAGSILDFELAAPGTSDLINVLNAGGLTINGGTLNLTDVGGLAAGSYTLIDYAGTLNGNVNNLTFGTTPAGFNYNLVDDGSVIKLDVTGATAVLIGDYNDDGVVNAADYVVWRDNLGAATLANNRDPANMGNVDINDYNSWKANFGATAGAGAGSSAAIPEPASVLLAGLAAIGLLALRRRTR